MKNCLATVIAALFCFALPSFGQETDRKAEELIRQHDSLMIDRVFLQLPENVRIEQSEQIMNAFPRHVNANVRKARKTNGFGIRIYYNSGPAAREESAQVASRFHSAFPEIEVARIFNSPYFMVTVGKYSTRGEAEHALGELRPMFPRAFVVKK